MHPSHHISPRLIIALVTGLLALAALLFTAPSAPAVEGHDLFGFFQRRFVTWSPPSVTATTTAGDIQTIPVSFTTPRRLHNVVARVSPELAPYVQVEPREFAWVEGGTTVHLNLLITAPPDALLGVIIGKIRLFREFRFHVRTRDGEKVKTFARPVMFARALAVSMEIFWQPFFNTEDKYSFQHPPDWEPSPQSAGGENLYEPSAQEFLNTDEHDTPPTVSTRILQKPQGLTLVEFASSWRDGWYAGYERRTTFTINGRETVLYNDLPDIGARQPPLAAFIGLGEDAVLLVLGRTDEETFLAILETMSFE